MSVAELRTETPDLEAGIIEAKADQDPDAIAHFKRDLDAIRLLHTSADDMALLLEAMEEVEIERLQEQKLALQEAKTRGFSTCIRCGCAVVFILLGMSYALLLVYTK